MTKISNKKFHGNTTHLRMPEENEINVIIPQKLTFLKFDGYLDIKSLPHSFLSVRTDLTSSFKHSGAVGKIKFGTISRGRRI